MQISEPEKEGRERGGTSVAFRFITPSQRADLANRMKGVRSDTGGRSQASSQVSSLDLWHWSRSRLPSAAQVDTGSRLGCSVGGRHERGVFGSSVVWVLWTGVDALLRAGKIRKWPGGIMQQQKSVSEQARQGGLCASAQPLAGIPPYWGRST